MTGANPERGEAHACSYSPENARLVLIETLLHYRAPMDDLANDVKHARPCMIPSWVAMDALRSVARPAPTEATQAASPNPDSARLGNLLARIHRDGGHYSVAHGIEKACENAEQIVAALHASSSETQAASRNAHSNQVAWAQDDSRPLVERLRGWGLYHANSVTRDLLIEAANALASRNAGEGERPGSWEVEVRVNGEEVLTIGKCLSGAPNVEDYRSEITQAAKHLLSFIGEPTARHASVEAGEVIGWISEWPGMDGKVCRTLHEDKHEAHDNAKWMHGTSYAVRRPLQAEAPMGEQS